MGDIPHNAKLTPDMTVEDIVVLMSRGNPGAVNVLVNMLRLGAEEGLIRILDMDDMGIRGDMVWIGFKDYAGSDLNKFMDGLRDRDQKLVDAVNREMEAEPGRQDRAVQAGASFR